MVTIHNRLNQRLIINLTEGKNLDIFAKGTASISEKDLSSPHLQALITRGEIVIVSTAKPGVKTHPEPKNEPKLESPPRAETNGSKAKQEADVQPADGNDEPATSNTKTSSSENTDSPGKNVNSAKTAYPVKKTSPGNSKKQ